MSTMAKQANLEARLRAYMQQSIAENGPIHETYNLEQDPDAQELLSRWKVQTLEDKQLEICQYLGKDTEVTIPSQIGRYKVTRIGKEVFCKCREVIQVIISEGIESVEEKAFYALRALRNVVFPKSLKRIGASAFYSCEQLPALTLPIGLEQIGEYAFALCERVEELTIPFTVHEIGTGAFSCMRSLAAINVQPENPCFCSKNGLLYSKDECKLLACPAATEYGITIPKGVQSVADYAFAYCRWITSVRFQSGLKSIGKYAFGYCEELRKIALPDSVTDIGSMAFCNCYVLQDVMLPERLQSLGDSVFLECRSLRRIHIPRALTHMGQRVFCKCNCLQSITIDPDNPKLTCVDGIVLDERGSVLKVCSKGKGGNLIIPNGVKEIEPAAFESCNWSQIVIPDSVREIGPYAFANCRQLQKISLPASLTELSNGIFEGCSVLHKISLPSSLQRIGKFSFTGCNRLKKIVIPENVKMLDEFGIYRCSNLESVVFYAKTRVGEYCFEKCKKVKIYAPLRSPAADYARKTKIPFEEV